MLVDLGRGTSVLLRAHHAHLIPVVATPSTSIRWATYWICPSRAGQFPAKIREQFELVKSPATAEEEQRRVKLLDSRACFAPLTPKDLPLEV